MIMKNKKLSKQRKHKTSDGSTVTLAERNELHFHVQKTTRATTTKNKKKLHPRQQKYNKKRIDY